MNPHADEDGTERDAWLREALRHAPDADVTAPPAVSDAILRQARSATARSSATAMSPKSGDTFGVWHGASTLWSWLARPPVATGFASIMVATLVVLMWWNRPMDEALPRSPAVAEAPATPTVAAPPSTPTTTPSPPTDSMTAAPAAAPSESAEPRNQVPSTRKSRPADATTAPTTTTAIRDTAPAAQLAKRRQQDLPSDERKSAASARADAMVPAAPRAAAAQEAPGPAPAPTQATAPAPATAGAAADVLGRASEREAAPPERARAELAKRPSAAPAMAERSPVPATQDQTRMSADRAAKAFANAAPAVTGPLSLHDEAAGSASPLAALRTSLVAQPQRWTWQRGTGAQQAMSPAVEHWLAQLDQSTLSAWRPASRAQPRDSTTPPPEDSAPLRLLRDGQLQMTLWLGGGTVRFDNAAGPAAAWQTTLPADAIAGLIQALDEATR